MRTKGQWWILTVFMSSTAMMYLDQSVLPVALPTMQKQLGASNLELLWCVNSYLFILALLVLAGGKMGDRIGYRSAFALGMLIFGAASALCGASPNVLALILARGLQGVGSALMLPSGTALLMSLFPPEQRGRAVGIQASVSSLFLILGPFLGGYLTQTLSWRWIFWINLPLVVLGLFLIFFYIPHMPGKKQKIDGQGFLFFAICSSSLIILLMQGKKWGWTSGLTLGLVLFFLLSLIFLLKREKKAEHPFLDLSLFRHPIYTAVNISLFVTQFILVITIFRAIFFQNVLDWSPIKTGTITVIATLPVLFMSMIGGMLSDRFGPKIPITLGFALLIFSFFWVAFYFQSSLVVLLLGLFAFGIGYPLISTPSYASAMGAIPPSKAGSAFGTISTTRSMALSIGVAAVGALINTIQHHFLDALLLKNPQINSKDPSLIDTLLAGGATARIFLNSLSIEKAQLVLKYVRDSEIAGFFYTHLLLGILLLITSLLVFFLYHRRSSHHLPETSAEGWD